MLFSVVCILPLKNVNDSSNNFSIIDDFNRLRESGSTSVDDYINASVIEVRNKVNYKLNAHISFDT